ncbi:aldo/keto reductase [Desulfonatronovibrio hydrogenovorans]|uniref:aldo/keto reductase n=1 Tax=Desulfonatronovibrio hydrogenovorans TaxID=53245 RepID=UPI00054F5968|nr:aldo/keto reductase [Desulfonatronovibrio hydrogenovorans]
MNNKTIEKIDFSSEARVTRVGLGGEGVLRTSGRHEEANAVIQEAFNQGITYFDTAPAYSGSEDYLGRFWKNNPGNREKIFHTSKSARRDRAGALKDLEHSLSRLSTDYLDLWQIHDVRTMEDFSLIAGPGGALEAFIQAREQGMVRHIGVTGHHDPAILTKCVQQWPLDSVLLPVNIFEGTLTGFLDETIPAARAKNMAVIGMKVLGGGQYTKISQGLNARFLLSYALSRNVDVCIVGCSTPSQVQIVAEIGRTPLPMPDETISRLHEAFRPYAHDLAFYRG